MQGPCLNTQHSSYKGRYRHKIGDLASQEAWFDKGKYQKKDLILLIILKIFKILR